MLLGFGTVLSAILAPGPFRAVGVGFDLHWMLLGVLCATVGLSAVSLALLARVFYDFEPRFSRRLLSIVTYNRGVAVSAVLVTGGIVPNAVLLARWLGRGFRLSAIQYSSVFGLMLIALGFQMFGFTLLLHMIGRRRRRDARDVKFTSPQAVVRYSDR